MTQSKLITQELETVEKPNNFYKKLLPNYQSP